MRHVYVGHASNSRVVRASTLREEMVQRGSAKLKDGKKLRMEAENAAILFARAPVHIMVRYPISS